MLRQLGGQRREVQHGRGRARRALVELVVTVSDEPRNAPPAKAPLPSEARRPRESEQLPDASAEEEDDDSADFFDFAHPRRARITFEVRDNGVGIPAAKQHALFVPFCQPAEHRAAKEKGTGLGLVITKSIVDGMGGEIDFVSVEDVGTRFFFTVSFQRADRLGERIASARRETRGVGSDAFDPSTSDVGVRRLRPTKATAEKARGSVDAVLDAARPGGSVGARTFPSRAARTAKRPKMTRPFRRIRLSRGPRTTSSRRRRRSWCTRRCARRRGGTR